MKTIFGKLKAKKLVDNVKIDKALDSEKMYKVIQEEGYFPTKDADGVISFKIKGTRVDVGECPSGFVYTRIYYGLDKEYVQAALYAANEVDKAYVAIKTLVVEENELLIFSVESYCKGAEVYREFFQRSLSILDDSIGRFHDEMHKLAEQQEKRDKLIDDRPQRKNESKMLS